MFFRFIRAIGKCLAVVILGLIPMGSWADVNSVVPTPTVANVQITRATSVTIRWRVLRFNFGGLPADTVFSTRGTFLAGGTTLGTVERVLSQSRPAIPGTVGEFVNFTETVLVPRNVVFRATKLGIPTVTYSRIFTDSDKANPGSVNLAVVGSGSAAFGVSRISLTFEDHSRVQVLQSGKPLQAIAEINFSGSGLLKAVWEVADSITTSGNPIFRTLRIVRRNLAGVGRVKLTSPALPTTTDGLYLVRFRVTDLATGFETPVLRYYVTPRPAADTPKESMRLRTPRRNARVDGETRFSWQPVAGALAYQLEVYPVERTGAAALPGTERHAELLVSPDDPARRPITGVVLPGNKTSTGLRSISLEHLEKGRRYRWRVMAIGKDGTVIGESALRDIHRR